MQVFLCFSQKFVLRTHISTHFQGSYCFRGAKVQQIFDIGEVLVISYFAALKRLLLVVPRNKRLIR